MSILQGGRGPSRRDFLVLGAGIFTVSAVGITRSRQRLVRRTLPVMGTLAEVAVVTRDESHAHRAISAAMDELHRVDRLMTRFNAASDVGRINAGAYQAPVLVDAATADVLEEALHWAAVPGSRFDPCLGRATELWHVTNRTEPPRPEEFRRFAGQSLHRTVRLMRAPDGARVSTGAADVAIDLGGIAKGYAVDRAVAALQDWGITGALVNAGGDLYVLGTSAGGEAWRVGIRSPAEPSQLAGTLALQDRAVATSGDYEQYFEHDGRRYHHLLDPATAAPRDSASHSLTVTAASCMVADAAATSVFGLTSGEVQRILAAAGRDARVARVA